MTPKSSTICVDANIAIRVVIDGPHQDMIREQWCRWVSTDTQLIAPSLFSYEITNTIWKYVYAKELSTFDAEEVLNTLLNLGIQLERPLNLHVAALKLAQEFQQTNAYDVHYLALARQYGCEFWTMDQRLYNSVYNKLVWVKTFPRQ